MTVRTSETDLAQGRFVLMTERITVDQLRTIMEAVWHLSMSASLLTAAYLDPDPSASFRKENPKGARWPLHEVRVVYVRNESPLSIMFETSPYVLAALVLFFKYPDKVATVFQRYRIAREIAKVQLDSVERWRDEVTRKGMGVDVSDLPEPPPDWLSEPRA